MHSTPLLSLRCRVALALAFALGWVAAARADVVDDIVRREMTQRQIPGLGVAMLKDGKVIKSAVYGVAGFDPVVPVTRDTAFRINSMTKPFTAMAVMMLVQDGRLKLEDPVTRHLQECPPAWREITVRHLLGHMSGLKDFINDSLIEFTTEKTDEQILAAIAAHPLKFGPGDIRDYNNSNYHVLAMMVSRISGQSYEEFLAARMFRPLGLTRTAIWRDDSTLPDRARGFFVENGRRRDGTVLPASIAGTGAGGLWSTVNDLARWALALESEQLLSKPIQQSMWTPAKLNNGAAVIHGLGWDVDDVAGHRRVSHGGKWLGFASHIDRYVDERLTVIVLTNLFDSDPGHIARAVAGTVIPALAPRGKNAIEDLEPAMTHHFADVLRRTAAGKLRGEDFADTTWPYVEPLMVQMSRDFAKFGPLQQLTLVERTEVDGNRSYRYRARFSRTSLNFHFVVTSEDRIVVMMPER